MQLKQQMFALRGAFWDDKSVKIILIKCSPHANTSATQKWLHAVKSTDV